MPDKVLLDFFESRSTGCYHIDEPLSLHTSYRVGGPADIFAFPDRLDTLIEILQFCKKNRIPFFFLGQGANVLVSDKGYRGVVVTLRRGFNSLSSDGPFVDIDAGVLLRDLVIFCEYNSLGGVEYLAGIPGTVGGALTMNAGVDRAEIGDVVEKVTILDHNYIPVTINRNEISFGYRSAPELQGRPVIGCLLKLSRANQAHLKEIRCSQISRRRKKQPLEMPSCGSVFKRPPGYYVGQMVEELGLKGFRHNDAKISEKHGGFILNCGNARADDILFLIKKMRAEILRQYNVKLEPEVRFLGFERPVDELPETDF
ncbi:MAG: UDP-N-acetylmuramate dehydrogenase [Chitinivibrionales bacterium]|nr:UDP-N-acetylmuramate dehydrogenase [Chitinivibrionales bacterium]